MPCASSWVELLFYEPLVCNISSFMYITNTKKCSPCNLHRAVYSSVSMLPELLRLILLMQWIKLPEKYIIYICHLCKTNTKKCSPCNLYIHKDVYSNLSMYVSYFVEAHPTNAMDKTTRKIYTPFTRT